MAELRPHLLPIPYRLGSIQMQKLRTRLVNFRVTNEEFERLKVACERHGARCLSDFARTVMLGSPAVDGESFGTKLAQLDRRVAGLEVSMSRLVEALAGTSVSLGSSAR